MPLIQQAKAFACLHHRATHHHYDGKPYEFHLEMVVEMAQDFIHLVPEADIPTIVAACWAHDLIEDCRQNFEDVKRETSEAVAEIVYALTNEKGKNRAERANAKYYAGIRNTPGATFVKLCDRLANVKHSLVSGGHKLRHYAKENRHFVDELFDPQYQEMFDLLEEWLDPHLENA